MGLLMDPQLFPKKKKKVPTVQQMGNAVICKHTFLGCFPWRYMEVWICLFDYNFFYKFVSL